MLYAELTRDLANLRRLERFYLAKRPLTTVEDERMLRDTRALIRETQRRRKKVAPVQLRLNLD